MMPAYRVLVTGSRTWLDRETVHSALDKARWANGTGGMTVVHGACPRGADALAAEWCRLMADLAVTEERHPALWKPGGRFDAHAGFKRNQVMVDAGADEVLAFVGPCAREGCRRRGVHDSHGARHCAERAMAAGIPVTWWRSLPGPGRAA